MRAPAEPFRTPRPPRPEFETVDPLTAGVFHAFGRALHLNRSAMARMAAQKGIQHGEAHALPLLCRYEGATQRELGEKLHLSPPRVSMLLRSLENAGAVVKRPDETDRRLTRVYITPKGRRLEKEQRVIFEDYVNRTIGALSEAERVDLERLLGRLAEVIEQVLDSEGTDKAPASESDR